jgi:anti-sigma regulatory factor (Ser/Thr protein kinase)
VTAQNNRLAISVASAPEAVAELRDAVCQFAQSRGFHDEKVEAIKLAVSEAATNAVLHGYSDDPGHISVVAELDESGALQVVVADTGRGMLPHRDSEGLGLGVPIMTTVADHMDIISPTNQGGTQVHMRFHSG